jgi:hypothetical protein
MIKSTKPTSAISFTDATCRLLEAISKHPFVFLAAVSNYVLSLVEVILVSPRVTLTQQINLTTWRCLVNNSHIHTKSFLTIVSLIWSQSIKIMSYSR